MSNATTITRRAHRAALGSFALVALIGATVSTASAAPAPTQVPDFFAQADTPDIDVPVDASLVGTGSNPSVSSDGRFVVFQGRPGSPLDTRTSTIYLNDRQENTTVELTPIPTGLRSGASVQPVLSSDGCTVITITEMALDVFRDDDVGERWDLYANRLPHCGGRIGAWELVSARPDGSGIARDDLLPEQTPTLSRSGTDIAFVHPADHLFEANGVTTITLVDQTVPLTNPGRAQFATGMPIDSPNTTFVHVGLDQPVLSGDGRYLAYRSDAASADAVPDWGTGTVEGGRATQQVFVWDRLEADPFVAVRLVSALADGTPSPAGASQPALSRDGRIVAFTSREWRLAAGSRECTLCPTQIYRLDRDADRDGVFDETGLTRLTLVSATDDRVPGNASSAHPALSADGNLVAFVSKATNLQVLRAPGGGRTGDGDILVADIGSGELRRLTVSSDGTTPAVGAHARPQLSATGRVTVVDTLASGQLIGSVRPVGRAVVAITAVPTLSMADADVGTTVVGAESSGWFVGLVNEGPTAFDPATVTVSDRRFVIDAANSSCVVGTLVPSGGSCNVWFSFTPTSGSFTTATLTVSESGFNALSVSSRIAGSGGLPTLQTQPGGADLGTFDVGASSNEFVFDVGNISIPPTFVRTVDIRGVHPQDFEVTTNNCLNRALNPRASCTVGVTFTPTDDGRRTALVRINTAEGQSTSIILGGDGVYSPDVLLLTDDVHTGDPLFAGGVGFPPNTPVTMLFGDTSRVLRRTVAGDDGTFIVEIPISVNERAGLRPIVARSTQGATGFAQVEVIERADSFVGIPGFGLGGY